MDITFFLSTLTILHVSSGSKLSKTTELLENLTTNYKTGIRPGLNENRPLVINVTFNVVALTKLNEVEGYISTVEFFDITWRDERISWNSGQYDGINSVTFSSDEIWTPELVISNPADQMYKFDERNYIVRYNNDGLALWRPGMVSKTLCDIQTPAYPFDVHACYIHVLLWGTLTEEIIFVSPQNKVVTTYYTNNSEWSLTESIASANIVGHIASITFGLQFSRRPTFLVVNILIPVIFLSLLNPVVFLLPHESGERLTFSVTILLSFTVFENVIADNVPKTSSPMPLVCYYVLIVLLASGVIVLLDTLYQRMYHTPGREPVPRWLLKILCFLSSAQVADKADEKIVTKDTVKDNNNTPKNWKDAIIRIDIISFVLFMLFAIILAVGFITSMANLQTGRLMSNELPGSK